MPRKSDVKTILPLTETEKAYLAGLVAGEGYMGITRSLVGKGPKGTKRGVSYRLHLSVHMTDPRPLAFAATKTGLGQAKARKKQKLSVRQSYVWNLWCNQAAQVIRELQPYFLVKDEQARLCLKFQDSVLWRGPLVSRMRNGSSKNNVGPDQGSCPMESTTSRKKILVIYHADCADGWTAAWAAWKKFGDSAEYVPAMYRPTDVFDVAGRDVYVLDYCPKRDVLEDYHKQAASFQVIDHHKSAEDWCRGLPYCLFDMDRSGASMAWDFFHPSIKRPRLVDYVEDRDIWRWALPDSKVVSSALFSYPLDTFENWSALADTIENNLDLILTEGRSLLRADAIAVAGVKKNAVLSEFSGYPDVPVVNTSGTNISEVLNQLSPPNFFAVGWYQRSNGTFKYSLRSKGDFDVAKLAEQFGGGGHKNASAFVSTLPPWELHKVAGLRIQGER